MFGDYETILTDNDSLKIGIKDNKIKIETPLNQDLSEIIRENKLFKKICKKNKNKITEHYFEDNKFIFVFNNNEFDKDNNEMSFLCMKYETTSSGNSHIIESKSIDKFKKLDKHYKQINIKNLIIIIEENKLKVKFTFDEESIPIFFGKKIGKIIGNLLENLLKN